MPLAYNARRDSVKKGKEPLVVRGEGYTRAPHSPPSDHSQQEHSSPPRQREPTRRSSSIPRQPPAAQPAVVPNNPCHPSDPSCGGCGKAHHGLMQLQYTQSLEQQIALLELENNYLKVGTRPPQVIPPLLHPPHRRWNEMIPELGETPPSTATPSVIHSLRREDRRREESSSERRTTDTELLHRLEEYSQKLLQLERKLKEKIRESKAKEESIHSLQKRLRELEGNLSTKSDADAQQKRALMEEILELQRRLDELTPILASKEAIISKLQLDKDELSAKLRALSSEKSQMQVRLAERGRDEQLRSEQEEERRRERQRVDVLLREKEAEIDACRSRERANVEEMTRMRREVKEEEMKRVQQKAMLDKLAEENGKLVKEVSRYAAEVSRLEVNAMQAEREKDRRTVDRETERQLAELREKESSLRIELSHTKDALEAEKECSTLMQSQLREGTSRESDIREVRVRMERELEALQALSKSLSAENTTLREEKLTLVEQMETLRMKVMEREGAVHAVEEKWRDAERRYEDALSRCEEENSAQRLRTLELEELGQKLKDLSESLPARTHHSSSTLYTRDELSSTAPHFPHTTVPVIRARPTTVACPTATTVIRQQHTSTNIDDVLQLTSTLNKNIH